MTPITPLNPFPPCGGRLGWGVMQCDALDSYHSECAPVGALPPIHPRALATRGSLRSLSLRNLPPQGGKGNFTSLDLAWAFSLGSH